MAQKESLCTLKHESEEGSGRGRKRGREMKIAKV
jgi:hypothetical protein